MGDGVRVVGAVIVRDGKILCAQRGPEGQLPGMWEFPGGKLEPGEEPEVALRREIQEELGCDVVVGEHLETTVYTYDFATISLSTYWCTLATGEPTPTEHSQLAWVSPRELSLYEWAPADIPAVAKLHDQAVEAWD